MLVDISLSKSMIKCILNHDLTLDDLEDIDPDLHKNFKWILENDIGDSMADNSFVLEQTFLGSKLCIELMENGEFNEITNSNKKEFVSQTCKYLMRTSIQAQLKAFMKGFSFVIPPGTLDIFSVTEFSILLSGIPEISLEEMKKHAVYKSMNNDDPLITYLWEALEEFD